MHVHQKLFIFRGCNPDPVFLIFRFNPMRGSVPGPRYHNFCLQTNNGNFRSLFRTVLPFRFGLWLIIFAVCCSLHKRSGSFRIKFESVVMRRFAHWRFVPYSRGFARTKLFQTNDKGRLGATNMSRIQYIKHIKIGSNAIRRHSRFILTPLAAIEHGLQLNGDDAICRLISTPILSVLFAVGLH